MNRRHFLRSALGASSALFLPNTLGCGGAIPSPRASGIEHVVVTMMENRSFDHLLGWLPRAEGRQAGLVYAGADGASRQTFPLAPDLAACGRTDPDHTYAGGRVQYDNGGMDGFLRAGTDYSLGYYVERDLPFFSQLALNFTVLDRYFCSVLGPTSPNRLFLHCGQSDRIANLSDPSTLPTIWDLLLGAGVPARYFYSNVSTLKLWGGKYDAISGSTDEFLQAARAGTLPAFSMVEPAFSGADGRGNDDHPPAHLLAGEALLSAIYAALTASPAWSNTVWIVTFDEWGGFFDHVPPPRAAAANSADPDIVGGKQLLGFRVPAVVASPWTRGSADSNRVNSLLFDHTSILRLLAWRWSLPPLGPRDSSPDLQNLLFTLDFAAADPLPPPLPLVPDPGFPGCP